MGKINVIIDFTKISTLIRFAEINIAKGKLDNASWALDRMKRCLDKSIIERSENGQDNVADNSLKNFQW